MESPREFLRRMVEGYHRGNTASVQIWRWWVMVAWGRKV